ncbi:flavin-binding monooxygenase family protein [Actinidia rufa]|uniref:Flavin-containing monooxygenase n=1 Tax=Actinidia rufa TaxID=165716 RepID=A0A7J0GAJ9_9ERIC|nr:flavin-binding monooxygenase family protein [Actinidia rufa]
MVSERKTCSKHVGVIGAGPSGLVAARELREEGHSVVVFEQSHEVGGQWLYNPNVENEDPLGKDTFLKVHSSMYASLRLTSPREIMGFTDFPFLVKKGRDMRRFPGHRELLLYLKDFCEWFGLRELIRFNTRVEYVGMLDYGEFGKDLRWVVRSKEEKCEKVVEEVFDAVVVATGHYSRPRLPSIIGMEAWKKKQMHSHVYRVPEPFRNEAVVVVGNSLSGQDISMELVDVAKHIYLSAEMDLGSLQTPSYIAPGISYSFPFLDTKGIVVVDDDRVGPLYEHSFPPSLAPSLSFVGIPRKLIGFPFFESQAKWIAQLLSGKKALPSWDDMMKSIKEFYHSRDADGYCDKYGDHIGFPHLEEWRKELCLSALRNADTNLETYRDSYDDLELLQEAHKSPHFTQLEPKSLPFSDPIN